MRTLIVLIFLILFLVIFSPIAWLVLWFVRKSDPAKADRIALAIVNGAFRIVGWLSGIRLTVKGHENIPADRPVVYMSNHRSYFDIVTGYPQVVGLCGFVAKKQVEKVPFLRVWMRMLYCQFLDRDNMREGLNTIKNCVKLVKEKNVSVWICPEGTRTPGDEMLPFKEGSFKIAEMSGAPVIPVTIKGSENVFEEHAPWIKAADVTMVFGEPVETEGLDRAGKKALPGQVRTIMEETLKSI